MLSVKRGVDATLESLKTSLPAQVSTSPRSIDLAEFVADAITTVRDAILIGGFLAIVVLLVFLRDVGYADRGGHVTARRVPTFLFIRLFARLDRSYVDDRLASPSRRPGD